MEQEQKKYLASYNDSAKLNKLLRQKKDMLEDCIQKSLNKLQRDKKRFYKDAFQVALQDEFNLHFKIGENKPKKEDDVVDFISFIDKYILSRKDLCEGSIKVMKGTRKHLLFGFNLVNQKIINQWKVTSNFERKGVILEPSKQIDFDQIDYNFFVEFHNYLLNATFSEQQDGKEVYIGYSKNFIAKQIKTTMHFANEAVKAGYLHKLSYKGFKASKEEADSVYLDWSEIEKLKALELEPNSLKGKVRNLFVFNCYCGLRYSDLKRLDKDRFTSIKDQLHLKIRMKKVDEVVMFPILPSAEALMKIYNYQLPTVGDQKYNKQIKIICQMAGITELEVKRETGSGNKLILTLPRYEMVSSHTGRRSFATNFFEDGVPINELMAITGHTTEAAFKNYVKSRKETKFAGFLARGANR